MVTCNSILNSPGCVLKQSHSPWLLPFPIKASLNILAFNCQQSSFSIIFLVNSRPKKTSHLKTWQMCDNPTNQTARGWAAQLTQKGILVCHLLAEGQLSSIYAYLHFPSDK